MSVQKKVKWLIEDFALENGTTELADTAAELGFEVKRCDHRNHFNTYWPDYFSKEECVVTQTSIQSARSIMKYMPDWFPGPWYKEEKFKCNYYYPFFGDYLFNDRYMMLPAGDVLRRVDDIFGWFGVDDCVFMRPTGGAKSFTGEIFKREEFEKMWDIRKSYGTMPHDVVVISTPKTIKSEYRYVIGDMEIIASSHYKGKKVSFPNPFVREVLKNVRYEPDRVWCLDIALDSDYNPWVLEVGSFSVSGLYECDKKDIILKVSEIAYDEFLDFHNEVEYNGN
jgi:hypothetical protein